MQRPDTASSALRGRRGWLITDDKIGMIVQARGVADALGLDYEWKSVSPQGVWRLMAPWGPVAPAEKFGAPGTPFAPPFPDVALATGRLAIPYLRALRKASGVGTYCVVLQDPRTSASIADLICVPEHDRRRGPNVLTTLVPAHSFTEARLAKLRASTPADIAALPSPRVAVILGGKSDAFKYTEADDDTFAASLATFARLGASFMITPSRRTHKRLLDCVGKATEGRPRILWRGEGENPYPQFLAHADQLIVTGDSANMTGEACATGRPVYVFVPPTVSPKFARFHDALRRYGATRPLSPAMTSFETWSYAPLDAAKEIAAEIERRWLRRQAMIPGLLQRA
ncbi:MAG TPA: mitochondrial fission ELM1 family protein [Hyphomicrobiaceae bacterium]|nr:mitochondrial fission ELM1 family protein [Hyphomicrobiaceae bacterium]